LSLLASFDSGWKNYQLLGKSYIREAYLKELYQLNQLAYYADQNGEFIGGIIGVTEEGLLQIMKGDEIKTYDIKEISFIYRNAF
jgi:biotin-(acetyl-CoA carboxylase) ligase